MSCTGLTAAGLGCFKCREARSGPLDLAELWGFPSIGRYVGVMSVAGTASLKIEYVKKRSN